MAFGMDPLQGIGGLMGGLSANFGAIGGVGAPPPPPPPPPGGRHHHHGPPPPPPQDGCSFGAEAQGLLGGQGGPPPGPPPLLGALLQNFQ